MIRSPEDLTVRRRRKVWKRDGGRCPLCEVEIPEEDLLNDDLVNLDHIRPRSHGGSNTLKNLQVTHIKCNSRKGNRCPGCPGCPPDKPVKIRRFVLDDVEDPVVRRARYNIWREHSRCVECHEVVYPSLVSKPEKVRFLRQPTLAKVKFVPIHVRCLEQE